MTLAVPAFSDLAVSIFLNGNQGPATSHNIRGFSYVADGDATGNEDGAPYTGIFLSWFFLADVEVLGATHRQAIVALGAPSPMAPGRRRPATIAGRTSSPGASRPSTSGSAC